MIIALAGLTPLVLCLAAASASLLDQSARSFAKRSIAAATASFTLAVLVAAGVALGGPARSPLAGYGGIGMSIHVDALAAVMLALVSFVGIAVVRYSRNYLDGDPAHLRFTQLLLLTLASVETLIIAGNLTLLILAFVATSLALNKLLLFYGDRPAAQRAAAKKFVTSRVGDLCLVIASCLLYARFGTLEIADVLSAAKANGGAYASWSLTTAALLIVTTAILKSAQLPLHGWLLEVMETPTPVSALLHAGIINAGGFLVLRLADVMLLARPALEVLAVIGGATALIASLVMLTQTAVKVQLAWSTIAQMGFMLLQCGLGAFSSALLHILAHSLYKAHAFLSSGSIMDLARASWTPSPGGQPHPARLVLSIAAVIGLTLTVAWLFGVTPRTHPARIALGCVLLMGLVHLVANAIDERPNAFVISRAALLACGVAAVYFALQAVMEAILAKSVPVGSMVDGTVEIAIAVLVVISFGAVTVFQNQIMRKADTRFWVAAYVHLKNGLYLNTLSNRLVLALWPKPASHATTVHA
ncbi:NADH-quinone oxidoreductase subunit L [Bradyrhizobium sp.]|uniref:NADH-quinone oxidoreductase subunit L n=1 Tax=Bradyrhizobium sp. TaxID=376 RepID=UPI0026069C50|nr:NADH-quinone oxidoreductase subunit L [Bradyrhizobium sp.]